MKLSFRLIAIIILACCAAAPAAPSPRNADKNKDKDSPKQSIDSGSFGVFMNGHRVGTEKFSIDQTNTGSTIKSEFKTENDPNTAVQESTLELAASGDIRRYEWNELSPGKAHSVIIPNNEFLNQKWSSGPGEKVHDQPYLLPLSTSILDDYFFIHREVLVWRFLAVTCQPGKGPGTMPDQAALAIRNPRSAPARVRAAVRRIPGSRKDRLQRQPTGVQ